MSNNLKSKTVVLSPGITSDPEICSGKPVIEGTRVMVWQILEYLAEGNSEEEIRKDFPTLPDDFLSNVLNFAASKVNQVQVYPSFVESESSR